MRRTIRLNTDKLEEEWDALILKNGSVQFELQKAIEGANKVRAELGEAHVAIVALTAKCDDLTLENKEMNYLNMDQVSCVANFFRAFEDVGETVDPDTGEVVLRAVLAKLHPDDSTPASTPVRPSAAESLESPVHSSTAPKQQAVQTPTSAPSPTPQKSAPTGPGGRRGSMIPSRKAGQRRDLSGSGSKMNLGQ